MPLTAKLSDRVRFFLKQPLREPVRRNAAERHAARLLVLIEDINRVALHEKVIRAVKTRGTRADHGHPGL